MGKSHVSCFRVLRSYHPFIRIHRPIVLCYELLGKWAATWQNQQHEFAPSEDSDQPGHPVWSESLLSAWRNLESLATHWAQAKTLISLGGCPGRSKSSQGAHSLCWFCHVAAQMCFSCCRQRLPNITRETSQFLSLCILGKTTGWLPLQRCNN